MIVITVIFIQASRIYHEKYSVVPDGRIFTHIRLVEFVIYKQNTFDPRQDRKKSNKNRAIEKPHVTTESNCQGNFPSTYKSLIKPLYYTGRHDGNTYSNKM